MLRRFLAIPCVLALAVPAHGETRLGLTEWRVKGGFDSDEARKDISGAACATPAWCLAVNDEKDYVQFFTLDTAKAEIDPGKRARVLAKDAFPGKSEADIEAAAWGGDAFYVTGSHGLPRQGGPRDPGRYFVYRLPADPATGAPAFEPDKDDVAPEIASTGTLEPLIAAALGTEATTTGPDDGGANIEGLAILGGTAYFGFRAPADGGAPVIGVALDELFSGSPADGALYRLGLGEGRGIRAMETVGDAILILSGPDRDQEGRAAPVLLGELDADPDWKGEGLLFAARHGRTVTLLVFFDSRKDGDPHAVTITLPE